VHMDSRITVSVWVALLSQLLCTCGHIWTRVVYLERPADAHSKSNLQIFSFSLLILPCGVDSPKEFLLKLSFLDLQNCSDLLLVFTRATMAKHFF
jgi:hypothetical protein